MQQINIKTEFTIEHVLKALKESLPYLQKDIKQHHLKTM